MDAIKFFGQDHLHAQNIVSACLAQGIKYLPAVKGFAHSVTVRWRPSGQYIRMNEQANGHGLNIQDLYDDWQHLRVVQLLGIPDVTALSDDAQPQQHTRSEQIQEHQRLSPITEVSEEDTSSMESASAFLHHEHAPFSNSLQQT